MYARKGSCSETCWGLIQSRKKSWRAGRCSAGGPVAAAAGVEVAALNGKVRWQEDRTCCYRSRMLTLQLLTKETAAPSNIRYVNIRCIKCKGVVVLTSLCCCRVYKERGLD